MANYEEWLKRARSSFILAKASDNEIYYEDLCFQAQQAVEKGLKGLLIYYGVEPEKTHNLSALLLSLEAYTTVDDEIREVLSLQKFAVQTRYPGEYMQIKKEDYDQSIIIADKCLKWVEGKIESGKLEVNKP